jgi:ABC-type sugar transport system permease subunit
MKGLFIPVSSVVIYFTLWNALMLLRGLGVNPNRYDSFTIISVTTIASLVVALLMLITGLILAFSLNRNDKGRGLQVAVYFIPLFHLTCFAVFIFVQATMSK